MRYRELRIELTWERAEGVIAAELASTWCNLAIYVGDETVTLVRDRRNDALRRDVRTSAYPLALWVAEHWWALTDHVRASAVESAALRWAGRFRPTWLPWHNVRGAGDGMPWPDLTILPEGGVARLVWFKGPGLAGQPVSFLTSGDAFVPMTDLRAELTEFVESVIARLEASGVLNTALQREWGYLGELDGEEQDFARACSRLGIDPFDMPATQADEVERLDDEVPSDLFDDFLDTADPNRLEQAVEWIHAARHRLRSAGRVPLDRPVVTLDDRRPWLAGYQSAQEVRQSLGLALTEQVHIDDLVGLNQIDQSTESFRGLTGRVDGGVGVVVPAHVGGSRAVRFLQAWALGLTILTDRNVALLDPSRRTVPRAARAFAAELLVPAAGIERLLVNDSEPNNRTFEVIAEYYGASSIVVERQYQNQILATTG